LATWLGFTPDGTRLVAVSEDGKAIHVWDLRLIRQQLVELVLDWDEPPYPPAPPPQKLEPLHVAIVGNQMASNPAAMLNWELQTCSLRLLGNPLDADAYFQRGRIYLQMYNQPQALTELNVALAFAPDHAGAHFLRGKLIQQYGRWQEACDDFTSLLQCQPDDHEIHRLRGACRVALGDHAGAARDYLEVLKHGDEKAVVLNKLAWHLVASVYFIAMCRHRLGDATAAKKDFDQAVRWQEQTKVSPARSAELQSFRAEAELILMEPMK
jgi:tetratricopeptide (TPR) repeat protein